MNICALDLSLTSTGWARSLTDYGTVRPGDRRGPERLGHILRAIRDLIPTAPILAIEGYAFARPNQAHQIGELGGVVRLWLHETGIPYVEVAPAKVKKAATGSGGASKAEVLTEAVRRLGYGGCSMDEADALWLYQMAAAHYGLSDAVALPKDRLAVIDSVTWPSLPASAVLR